MALRDVYSQQAFAPSQQLLQQQTEGARALPGLHQQGIAIREQEIQQARGNRPVTPYQKAVMRLMAGEDPAQVARDTKVELGTAGMPMGGTGQPPPSQESIGVTMMAPVQAMPQATHAGPMGRAQPMMHEARYNPNMGERGPFVGEQMRQPLPAARSFAMDRNPEPKAPTVQSESASGPAQWQGRGGITEDTFNGMTGRDFEDYVATMGKAGQMKYHRTSADLMELEKEKTRRALAVEDKRGASRKEVAEIRRDLGREQLSYREYSDELKLRVKNKELDEKTAHHVAEINLGYARIAELRERFSMARDQTDRLELAKLLVKQADSMDDNFSKVESSLTGLVGMNQMDIRADMARRKAEVGSAWKEAKAEIERQKTAPVTPNKVEKKGEREKGPAGKQSKKWKVGESFSRGGKTYTVKAVDAEGRIASYE